MGESLKGKITLVSGAASGIGKATAQLFAREGAVVLVADFDEEGGRETAQAISEAGGQTDFYQVDVSKADQMAAMFRAIDEKYGGLDVLMNNAGIAKGGGKGIDVTPEEDFDQLVAVNLRGVFLGIKYGVPLVIKRGGGRIINTASVAGLVGYPGNCGYAASKAGVVSLTKTAALEYGKHNISVNCICPAYVDTPILTQARPGADPEEVKEMLKRRVPIRRIGTPDEVAETALYLAAGPGFVTGTAIVIDGGVTAM
jgi:NAD(P)-dependent dehydrogenase (short-subunit alcohol dehydrogenase family)